MRRRRRGDGETKYRPKNVVGIWARRRTAHPSNGGQLPAPLKRAADRDWDQTAVDSRAKGARTSSLASYAITRHNMIQHDLLRWGISSLSETRARAASKWQCPNQLAAQFGCKLLGYTLLCQVWWTNWKGENDCPALPPGRSGNRPSARYTFRKNLECRPKIFCYIGT
jgi:hypothetical protein